MKISQDSLKFSNDDSEVQYMRRQPSKLILPRYVEISGEFDVSGTPLKPILKTVISFFNCLH